MASVEELSRKYSSQLSQLQAIFPSWDEGDLAFTLQDTKGNVEDAVLAITEGPSYCSQAKDYCSCQAEHLSSPRQPARSPPRRRRPNRAKDTRTVTQIPVDGRTRTAETLAVEEVAAELGVDEEVEVVEVEVRWFCATCCLEVCS